MTSRLKRKLDDVQDVGNLGESFVKYGTPLPALSETKKDQGEFVPIWKQEVRDEQGRKRLHGAWTGGFSAGYFNTVGSKEGWTPSTFKSSRSTKAASSQQKAEDFMDEEDLAEMRAGQKLQTSAEFDLLDGTAGEIARHQEGAASTLRDMVEPSRERIGERLLRRMGWREGQGVGPRISLKARRRQAKELGVPIDDDMVEDDEAHKHTFAPIDRQLVIYEPKDNMTGLGTRSGQKMHQEQRRTEQTESPGSRNPLGGAWGLGAMEDADEDDLSVYDSGRPSKNRHMVLMDDEGESISLRPQAHHRTPVQSAPRAALSGSFNDGSPIIRHFVAASRSQAPDTWFEPPTVPKDWQPNPRRIFASALTSAPQQSITGSLTADQRGRLLGEDALKGPPPSVLEYLKAKDRERLAANAETGARTVTAADSNALPDDAAPLHVPEIDAALASAALKGFLPFADDVAKQVRYKRYLEHHAGLRPEEAFRPWAAAERIEELNRELSEFAASARIFKPMSNAMASRFQSSSVSTILLDVPEPGLRKPAPAPTESQSEQKGEDESPVQMPTTAAGQAAREGRFGPLTRITTRFYPVRLVCKRFNVPDPWPDGPSMEEDAMNDLSFAKRRKDTYDEAPRDSATAIQRLVEDKENEAPPPNVAPKPLGSVGLGDDETQGRDTLNYERPPDALFKAIFGDSEDEEDDADDTDVTVKEYTPLLAEPSPAWMQKKPPTVETADAATQHVDAEAPFRPTFVKKADRQKSTSVEQQVKKKRSKATIKGLSFDLEDKDFGGSASQKSLKAEKAVKVKKNTVSPDYEEDLWVEKEVPVPSPLVMQTSSKLQSRMKASDLY